MKVKLPDSEIVKAWKVQILSLLKGKFAEGVTPEDVLSVFPVAPLRHVTAAIEDLKKEKVVEEVE